jgi:hypothetical protein
VIAVLVLTCRPAWQKWFEHQLAKQETPHKLLVLNDCYTSQVYMGASAVLRPARRNMSLGEKRQQLLNSIPTDCESFCWLDDDDWIPRWRLAHGGLADVVGCRDGLFCDVQTMRTRRLETGTPVVFNGALFDRRYASVPMLPLERGEDTMWLNSVCKDATILSSPMLQHAWLCHDSNVTGKRGSMSFEGPTFAGLDDWERRFLAANFRK